MLRTLSITSDSRHSRVLRLARAFAKSFAALMLVVAFMAPLRAAEITTYRDKDGRCIYVTVEDHDLGAVVKQGGVAAGLRLIDQRKEALPDVDRFIEEVAGEQRLDPKLVHAVIQVESAWNPRARSNKGALGLMQLMPATATRFGVSDPFDPKQNIRAGARYLRILLDQFKQNLTHALAAYNAGEGAVIAHGGVPPYQETRNYIVRINALYGDLLGQNPKQLQIQTSQNQIPPIEFRKTQDGRTLYTNLY